MQPETLGLLVDIRDAARFIIADTADTTYDEFLNDRRMRQAVLYSFLIIGEALNRLRRRDPDIAERISDPRQIVGMRNALIHGYDVTDYPIVWRAIQETLPILREQIEELLPAEDREAQQQPGR
jgi:uncharacterized protein with HEPN domain